MKKIAFYLGRLFSVIYPEGLKRLFDGLRRYIYTGYSTRGFRCWGKGSTVMPHWQDLRGKDCIQVGDYCLFYRDVELTAWTTYQNQTFSPQIVIGNGCTIRNRNHITAINKIVIGNNLLTGPDVLITDNAHGLFDTSNAQRRPQDRELVSKGEVVIGDNVWIGEKATILPGVHIGNGVIIAANSVVTNNIPDLCMAAGNPAKIVKNLNPQSRSV